MGIDLASATDNTVAGWISLHGEIVAPSAVGSLPVSSTSDLAALAANQTRADADLGRARADLEIAQRNADRAEALLREEAGSVRARDESLAALAVARANLHAAQLQRAQFGPAIDALNTMTDVWIRVSVPVGDLIRVQSAGDARVGAIGGQQQTAAKPVPGPPSANATWATVDLYYAMKNPGASFRIGQRVAINLPANRQAKGLAIPHSAVLLDIYGGEWVYVTTADHTYERRRVEVAAVQDGVALLSRGLHPGDRVVAAGAAELFGTEFGAK
ncbi:efflux RND transporter periplasmic adaptor subunit [Steroidobacter cummioxidans]|uniref:efflux RND transporter periplasmic adaptor subunit n=1 Tax=Steroidobacter cummioxidans TaxID=1803913 RepID=UPI00128FD755|nr:efflux RND transporter periplasmic adaptor subunit [Steroidobacter cummioxidans]